VVFQAGLGKTKGKRKMIKQKERKPIVQKRHRSIRLKVSGTAEFPRLAVYRSTKHIYAQLIDDENHVTLASASSNDKDIKESLKNGGNIEAAKVVGEAIAKKAKKAGVECVVFDRGGFLYHGRVAALADAAREAGLMF
jgi:large subunit ribosomal protein L18